MADQPKTMRQIIDDQMKHVTIDLDELYRLPAIKWPEGETAFEAQKYRETLAGLAGDQRRRKAFLEGEWPLPEPLKLAVGDRIVLPGKSLIGKPTDCPARVITPSQELPPDHYVLQFDDGDTCVIHAETLAIMLDAAKKR